MTTHLKRNTTEINWLEYSQHVINKSCIGILPHHISIRPDYPIIYHIALQAREHFPHKTLSFLHYSKLCQNDWLFYCLERLSNRLLFQTGTRGSSWRALLAPRLSGLTSSHSSRFCVCVCVCVCVLTAQGSTTWRRINWTNNETEGIYANYPFSKACQRK